MRQRDITPCVPPRANRADSNAYETDPCSRRKLVERLKDRYRISIRHDRCAYTFLDALRIAAVVTFWLWVRNLAKEVDCAQIVSKSHCDIRIHPANSTGVLDEIGSGLTFAAPIKPHP